MTRLLIALAWLLAIAPGALAAAADSGPDAQSAPPAEVSPPPPSAPASAASSAPAATPPGQAAPAPKPVPQRSLNGKANASPALNGISPDQARVALDVLNDPAKRAAFAATLTALIKAGAPAGTATSGSASPGTAPAAPADPAPSPTKTTVEGIAIPLAPDSLGAQVLVSASGFVNQLGNQAMDALDAAQSVPLLWGWLVVMATNPTARDLLQDVSWRLAFAVSIATAVGFTLRWAMRRPIRGLEEHAPEADGAPDADPTDTANGRPRPAAWVLLRRVPLILARLVLELVPVLGILAAGHLLAASRVGGHEVSRLIILAVVDAYAICMALLCVARMLLSPGASRLRLFHLPDSVATYLVCWTRRLAVVAVFGYALGEVLLLLGLSEDAHDLLQKSVALVLYAMVAIVIIQKRRAVRRVLRAPDEQTGFGAALRNRLAAIWHWIALFFLSGAWLVWAIEVPHGFTALIRYSAITAAVLIGARLTVVVCLGVVERAMRPPADKQASPASLNVRLATYYPIASLAIRTTIWVLSIVGLLQLYGANSFVWLTTSTLGLRVVNAAATILLTIAVALVVWEAANAALHRHLDRLQAQAQHGRSARLRTLLPLLRTALLICIGVFAGLTVLSEIGINVAPLLAGAGIVGVAIGLGSQKLVQDLINGIFLLLENAMQVGDYVTVSGLSGTVEALSVRAIRLRASDGSVHLIPFSAVTSVTNVNRGLGNASVNVTVAFQEDADRVMAELKAIVSEMRNDVALSALMLSDLQLWGVDKVDGSGVTITGQIVCTDAGRWPVQREFNRRMKQRFQELGIRMVNPLQRIEVAAVMPRVERRPEGVLEHGKPGGAA